MFYDYKCKKCNHVQEERHSILKEPKIRCEKCNSLCKRQMPNTANFILKGDDWAGKRCKHDSNSKVQK